jgi:energy-converting hydrogenase Eha subunit F
MGLIVFISIIAIIAILGILIAYGLSRNQLFPPYQEPIEPVAKEDIQAAWPFPTGKRP